MYGVLWVRNGTGGTLRWEVADSLCSSPNSNAQLACLFPAFQFRKKA